MRRLCVCVLCFFFFKYYIPLESTSLQCFLIFNFRRKTSFKLDKHKIESKVFREFSFQVLRVLQKKFVENAKLFFYIYILGASNKNRMKINMYTYYLPNERRNVTHSFHVLACLPALLARLLVDLMFIFEQY